MHDATTYIIVSGAKFVNNLPFYLMLKRIWRGGDFWQGVTGGVEDNETLKTAAIRELKEETGFKSKKLIQIDYIYKFPPPKDMLILYDKPYDFITENSFLTIIDNDQEPTIDPIEHKEYKWCPFEEAIDLLFWERNKVALRHAQKIIIEMLMKLIAHY